MVRRYGQRGGVCGLGEVSQHPTVGFPAGVFVFSRVLALAVHVALRDQIFGNRDGQAECAGDSWIFMNAATQDSGLIGFEFL